MSTYAVLPLSILATPHWCEIWVSGTPSTFDAPLFCLPFSGTPYEFVRESAVVPREWSYLGLGLGCAV